MLLQVNANNTIEIIKAIGSTWPFLLVVILTVIFLVYRKDLTAHLGKFNKISGKMPLGELHIESAVIKDMTVNEQELVPVENTSAQETNLEEKESEANKRPEGILGLYLSLTKGDYKEADEIFSIMQEGTTGFVEREKNELLYLQFKNLYAGIDTTDQLKAKVQNAPVEIVQKGYEYLGNIYIHYKDYSSAIDAYEAGIKISENQEWIVNVAAKIAEAFYLDEKKEQCFKYLLDLIPQVCENKAKSRIYVVLSEFYERENDKLKKALALEMASIYAPTDSSILFSAAYEYSSDKVMMEILALSHYKSLVYQHPQNAAGWNNLGVAYDRLSLNGKSIYNYNRANELNNTLAASNIAQKYMLQGFYEEAKELMLKAKDNKVVHENVWAILNQISEKEKSEAEKEKQLLENANRFRTFLKKFCKLYFSTYDKETNNVEGIWMYQGTVISVARLNNPLYFEFKWTATSYNYEIYLPLADSNSVIGEGKRSPVGGGIVNKLKVFGYLNNDKAQLNVFVYDTSDNSGSIHEFIKT